MNKMKVNGIEIEPYSVMRVLDKHTGKWEDFCTIKDADDCYWCQRMFNGTHHQFQGTYRIERHGKVITSMEVI